VYAVNYPASNDFVTSTPAGANDASAHIQSMAGNCPGTRMVLGGYSQGAAVIDMATNAMPAAVANHVAADAVFGAPRSTFADTLAPGPSAVTGPLYVGKTLELCVPNDPICWESGWDMRAHGAYVQTGMVDQAADFLRELVPAALDVLQGFQHTTEAACPILCVRGNRPSAAILLPSP